MSNQYSIVGIGRHAKNKIIPFMENTKCKIGPLFSSKKHKYKTYNNIKKFIRLVPKKNIFYISSAPHLHFNQSRIIIKNNFHILCEKPSFIRLDNFNSLKKKIIKKKLFFVEIIIFRYSLLFKYFCRVWNKNKKNIKKIDINFLIPKFNTYGFRKDRYNWLVCLYDIGIYPISLLNLLNIQNYKIFIKNIVYKKNKIIKEISFSIINKNYVFNINIGEDNTYKNNVVLYFKKNKKINFEHFFYGLKKKKKIKYYKKTKIIKDRNCFEAIFKKSKKFWLKRRIQELNYIHKNILFLKKIERKILSYKSN